MQISIHRVNQASYNKNRTSFKSRMFEIQNLQNIKNVPCACCGRKVISPDDIAHTFAQVTRPFAEMLSKGFMNSWKENPVIWQIFTTFAEKYPNDSFDTIVQRDEEDFHSIRSTLSTEVKKEYPDEVYSELNRISKRVYKNMISQTRTELDTAEKVMQRFSIYKPYMRGKQLDAFETLQIYAQQYPDKRLSEIINTPKVYESYKARQELNSKKRNEKLDFHFNNILKIIKVEDPLSVHHFQKFEYDIREMMIREHDSVARKEKTKNLYLTRLEFMKCSNVSKQVLDEINQFPDMTMNEDDFFVYAHDNNYTDEMIIKTIISPFMGSFEHIIPQSHSGSNSIYNGIVMCTGCNKARNTRPYDKVLMYHPEMQKNTQKQINHIIRYILTGKIDDVTMSRWPIVIARSLNIYTNGALQPDISEYCDLAIRYVTDKYKSEESEIEKMDKTISNIEEEKNKLVARLEVLNKKQTEYNNRLEQKIKDNKSREYDLNFLQRVAAGKIEGNMAHAHEKIEPDEL